MNDDKELMYKELVTVVIEKALLNIGMYVYNTIVQILKNEYQCQISDCYEHPEYLHQVIKKHFSSAHKDIVDSINKDLRNSIKNQITKRFLDIINQ
ncbi:MAG TPA: hypothetical protein VEU72_04110 [Nitrosopumilaceae archaeon]|nr:hypothetical protein [Nitrosopumilaceae archaeon]